MMSSVGSERDGQNSTELPFVTIIVPVLNGERDVKACVEALRKQNYPSNYYEIIIVDNGSTDNTVQLLKEVGISYYIRMERGRSCALNTGVRHAKGSIICSTDISCRPEPQWISSIVNSFRDESVGCVAGEIRLLKNVESNVICFQERQNYMSPMHAQRRKKPPYLPFADGANASFRRQLFEEIGLFDEDFIKGADVEICYRMILLTKYRIAFNEQAVVWEPGEPTLMALLRQRFRMGIGNVLMRMKYAPLYRERGKKYPVKKVYWIIHNIWKTFRNLAIENVNSMLIVNNRNIAAYDKTVRVLMTISQMLGRTYGRFYLRIKGIKPKTVDPEKIEVFLLSSECIISKIVFSRSTS